MATDILLTIVTMVFALLVVFSKRTVVAALSLLMTLVLYRDDLLPVRNCVSCSYPGSG